MKTILICNEKGGSGKTTIAEALSWRFYEEQIPFNYYDLDKQGGAYFADHKEENAIVEIVDTPGRLHKDLKKWIEAADFIIIPTLVSVKDVAPLQTMIELIEPFKESKKILFVFNRWTRFNNTKDFIRWFEKKWPDFDTAILNNTSAVDDAAAREMSVGKFKPSSQAAKQIQEIYSVVKHGLNLKEGWRG